MAGVPGRAAAALTTDSLTAEVAVRRALDADERAEQRAAGTPPREIDEMRVWGDVAGFGGFDPELFQPDA